MVSSVPDYFGYVFYSEPCPSASAGTVFAQERYLSFVPSDNHEKWLKKQEGVDINIPHLCFRILEDRPNIGTPAHYTNSWCVISTDDPDQKVFIQQFKSIGKFIVDEEGRRYPWVPGAKSKLQELGESENSSTPLELIQKAETSYFSYLDYKNSFNT